MVTLPEAKHGFVLLPRRWVVERDFAFAWTARFRRLARDYERLPQVLAGLHFIAFACLMLHRLIPVLLRSQHALGPLRDIALQSVVRLQTLLDEKADRDTLFAAFLDDLRRGGRPAIVVFEDVHWADEATLDLIKFLGRRIQHSPTHFIPDLPRR